MEKERITMSDMIIQTINGNQLSAEEEVEIMKFLRERGEEREKKRMSRCLAGVIDGELKKKVEQGIYKESTVWRYHPIYKRCFQETKIGNMDAAELSESIIKEYIMEAHESFGLTRNEMYLFMRMLQIGINKMSELKLLNFVPDKKIYRSYVENDKGIKYIENPYSPEETNKIMEWVENNFSDVRGLAVALWLSCDISPEEIVTLKKDDCWENDKDLVIGKGIFVDSQKLRYVTEAFKLHPANEQYVFMIKKDGRWRKLNERSLQIKLYYMCQDIGITFRAFHKNEAILPSA